MPIPPRIATPTLCATTAVLVALVLTGAGASVAAQTCNPPASTSSPTIGDHQMLLELHRRLDEQRARLDAQAATIEAQGHAIETLRTQVAAARAAALATREDAAAVQQPHPPAALDVETRPPQVEPVVQPRMPEMPTEVVLAGDFPGSIVIPGTAVAFKIGGQARQTLVHTLQPLGTDDRFDTSSIPVTAAQQPGDVSRTVYSPQPSRLNLDIRTVSPIGPFRTFLEGDFAGDGDVLRLRHAFIQGRRWVVGQTWSTFSDPEAEPIGIDFEGLNAISRLRQPQIRYTLPLREQLRFALALENPIPDLTGAQGVSLMPDVIARLRWEPRTLAPWSLLARAEHVQAAVLVRQLRGEPDDRPEVIVATGGFGGNVSGVLVPRWDSDDRMKFAVNAGWGIGRYITDLGSLGGQDAVFDPMLNDLRALAVSSGYFGYERRWGPIFSSTFTYGIVNVRNLDIQPNDALRRTQRTSLNLTWSLIPQADLVLEFLAGTRMNKDRSHAMSSQLQAGWTFKF